MSEIKKNDDIAIVLKQHPFMYSNTSSKKSIYLRKAIAFEKMLSTMYPSVKKDDLLAGRRTIYNFPIYLTINEYDLANIGNLTPNYNTVLTKGFKGIKQDAISAMNDKNLSSDSKDFLSSVVMVCESVIKFSNRYSEKLLEMSEKYGDSQPSLRQLAQICKKIPAEPATNFYQALQSVFFTNMLIWSEEHHLIGLGRLDQYLWPYYQNDIAKGICTADEMYELSKHFWKRLNEDFREKSNVLAGDTGQAVILGGLEKSRGEDASNELTYMFLKIAKELKQVDPKIVLRVHSKTPEKLWKESLALLKLGLGYPLYASDDVIIPSLKSFGYDSEDAIDYVVSACWEPLIPGKSFELNNVCRINFLHCLESSVNDGKSLLDNSQIGVSGGFLKECNSFEDLIKNLKSQIHFFISQSVERVNNLRFVPSPLFSALTANCIEKGLDISKGGAKYNNFGILNSGFVNMVNSLIAIKKLVYENNQISKIDLLKCLKDDFENNMQLCSYMKNRIPKFGNDIDEVDSIASELADFYGQECAKESNSLGGRYKGGLGSADGYVTDAKKTAASCDGRKLGEILTVNFSPAAGTVQNGLTAVVNSISKINFRKVFNGSILDLKLSPSFFTEEKYLDKLVLFLKVAMRKCEEIQFNVVNSQTLKDAKNNPDQYRDLIVRVWGFSAYFVDLPEEYQNHIIERSEHDIQ